MLATRHRDDRAWGSTVAPAGHSRPHRRLARGRSGLPRRGQGTGACPLSIGGASKHIGRDGRSKKHNTRR